MPPIFREDFAHGSFHWDWEHEKCVEKLWPMGPVCALGNGRIWPVLFLYKKGYYLVRGDRRPPESTSQKSQGSHLFEYVTKFHKVSYGVLGSSTA